MSLYLLQAPAVEFGVNFKLLFTPLLLRIMSLYLLPAPVELGINFKLLFTPLL